ncbi:MAG TPA: glycosyltransferase family 9 protein [Bacteroidota bacterium]|nr:glycosyltransferase family 9 protein [Bacteroidota bacterium]
MRAIGDVLLSTAGLPDLRREFPDARIDFLTEKASREVIDGNPYIDSSIIFDRKSASGLVLLADIRRRNYDLVIDLFGNPRSALITLASGARYRAGFRFKWRQYCYNIVIEPRGGKVHNVEFNLDALRALGVPVSDPVPTFPLNGEAEQFANEFFEEAKLAQKTVVALNGGGGWYTKRWRIPQFAALADRIVAKYDAAIMITWGPGEEEDALRIRSLMNSEATIIPRTSLKQLGALLKRASVLVTNDSGPMHIAAAVGTPILAIFGPTNPELQGPYNVINEIVTHQQLVCLGCNFTRCPIGNPCMESLEVNDVFSTFMNLMSKIRKPLEQPV